MNGVRNAQSRAEKLPRQRPRSVRHVPCVRVAGSCLYAERALNCVKQREFALRSRNDVAVAQVVVPELEHGCGGRHGWRLLLLLLL